MADIANHERTQLNNKLDFDVTNGRLRIQIVYKEEQEDPDISETHFYLSRDEAKRLINALQSYING